MSEYRAGRFVALRELSITQAKKEIVLFNGKDRSPEDMKNDLLLNSSQEIQTRILFSLQEVLAAIMPQVREEMCQFSQGKIYPDVAPALFADTISLHICKVFFDQWYTAFLGAGGIIELWIDVAVVGCFKGPTVLDKTELYLNEWRNDLESFEKFYDDKVEEILNTPVGIVRQYLLLQLEPVREQLVTHKRKLVAAELRRSMAKQAAKDKAWPESVLEEKETKLFNAVVASQTQ
ncbi:hypothetical protein GLAREA_05854 [Glarea lozoyensis ATCC 20868]|nr:uncharacterized protein GLAREA_05854 [Glarea lozoyensis ATCC 20868]EPE32842.1 hypothetical protein GLAREA_05854 [Glarea lozoyensis ATCC 20868]